MNLPTSLCCIFQRVDYLVARYAFLLDHFTHVKGQDDFAKRRTVDMESSKELAARHLAVSTCGGSASGYRLRRKQLIADDKTVSRLGMRMPARVFPSLRSGFFTAVVARAVRWSCKKDLHLVLNTLHGLD